MSDVQYRRRAQAPCVLSQDELPAIIEAVQKEGMFSFDVETRGNIENHGEVMELVEAEWAVKRDSLKSTNPNVVQRSRKAIEDKWRKDVALDPLRNEVFWIGIATKGQSWAIPMGHPNGDVLVPEKRGDGSTVPPIGHRSILASGKESMAKAKYHIPAVFTDPPEQLSRSVVFEALETLFMDDSIVMVNQNIKFDVKSVAKYYGGVLPKGRMYDTQVLMHIVNENLRSYRLGDLIKHVFGFDPYEREGKVGAIIVDQPFNVATRYVHYDARWAWLLASRLLRFINRDPDMVSVSFLESDTLPVIAQMELNGIAVNRRQMIKVGQELDLDINNLIADVSQFAPPGFNPDSNNDKAALLFNKKREGGLGLKPPKKTGTGKFSVDNESLRSLQGKHPAVDLLLEYAEVKKLKSTYIEGLVPKLHKGRLHPSFHQHRTKTGRLASSGPNLQNIPRDGRLRSLFVAEPGNSLIVADYSQIEMRIMAMFSQDPALLNIFQNNIDVHTGTAAVILGKDFSEITPDERQVYGKTPNFLMGYGGGPLRLVTATNGALTFEEAEKVVANYNSGYGVFTEWKHKTIRRAIKDGYVRTKMGRKRRLPELRSDDWKVRASAERQAINAVIQGTAAEICKEAMVDLHAIVEGTPCKILVQVHDELVTTVPSEEVAHWAKVIEDTMGNGRVIDGVALEVEAHYAGSWADAKG
jgi:DNA polymerase I-like protein with 3'-5' exonuclease and polymerase domains